MSSSPKKLTLDMGSSDDMDRDFFDKDFVRDEIMTPSVDHRLTPVQEKNSDFTTSEVSSPMPTMTNKKAKESERSLGNLVEEDAVENENLVEVGDDNLDDHVSGVFEVSGTTWKLEELMRREEEELFNANPSLRNMDPAPTSDQTAPQAIAQTAPEPTAPPVAQPPSKISVIEFSSTDSAKFGTMLDASSKFQANPNTAPCVKEASSTNGNRSGGFYHEYCAPNGILRGISKGQEGTIIDSVVSGLLQELTTTIEGEARQQIEAEGFRQLAGMSPHNELQDDSPFKVQHNFPLKGQRRVSKEFIGKRSNSRRNASKEAESKRSDSVEKDSVEKAAEGPERRISETSREIAALAGAVDEKTSEQKKPARVSHRRPSSASKELNVSKELQLVTETRQSLSKEIRALTKDDRRVSSKKSTKDSTKAEINASRGSSKEVDAKRPGNSKETTNAKRMSGTSKEIMSDGKRVSSKEGDPTSSREPASSANLNKRNRSSIISSATIGSGTSSSNYTNGKRLGDNGNDEKLVKTLSVDEKSKSSDDRSKSTNDDRSKATNDDRSKPNDATLNAERLVAEKMKKRASVTQSMPIERKPSFSMGRRSSAKRSSMGETLSILSFFRDRPMDDSMKSVKTMASCITGANASGMGTGGDIGATSMVGASNSMMGNGASRLSISRGSVSGLVGMSGMNGNTNNRGSVAGVQHVTGSNGLGSNGINSNVSDGSSKRNSMRAMTVQNSAPKRMRASRKSAIAADAIHNAGLRNEQKMIPDATKEMVPDASKNEMFVETTDTTQKRQSAKPQTQETRNDTGGEGPDVPVETVQPPAIIPDMSQNPEGRAISKAQARAISESSSPGLDGAELDSAPGPGSPPESKILPTLLQDLEQVEEYRSDSSLVTELLVRIYEAVCANDDPRENDHRFQQQIGQQPVTPFPTQYVQAQTAQCQALVQVDQIQLPQQQDHPTDSLLENQRESSPDISNAVNSLLFQLYAQFRDADYDAAGGKSDEEAAARDSEVGRGVVHGLWTSVAFHESDEAIENANEAPRADNYGANGTSKKNAENANSSSDKAIENVTEIANTNVIENVAQNLHDSNIASANANGSGSGSANVTASGTGTNERLSQNLSQISSMIQNSQVVDSDDTKERQADSDKTLDSDRNLDSDARTDSKVVSNSLKYESDVAKSESYMEGSKNIDSDVGAGKQTDSDTNLKASQETPKKVVLSDTEGSTYYPGREDKNTAVLQKSSSEMSTKKHQRLSIKGILKSPSDTDKSDRERAEKSKPDKNLVYDDNADKVISGDKMPDNAGQGNDPKDTTAFDQSCEGKVERATEKAEKRTTNSARELAPTREFSPPGPDSKSPLSPHDPKSPLSPQEQSKSSLENKSSTYPSVLKGHALRGSVIGGGRSNSLLPPGAAFFQAIQNQQNQAASSGVIQNSTGLQSSTGPQSSAGGIHNSAGLQSSVGLQSSALGSSALGSALGSSALASTASHCSEIISEIFRAGSEGQENERGQGSEKVKKTNEDREIGVPTGQQVLSEKGNDSQTHSSTDNRPSTPVDRPTVMSMIDRNSQIGIGRERSTVRSTVKEGFGEEEVPLQVDHLASVVNDPSTLEPPSATFQDRKKSVNFSMQNNTTASSVRRKRPISSSPNQTAIVQHQYSRKSNQGYATYPGGFSGSTIGGVGEIGNSKMGTLSRPSTTTSKGSGDRKNQNPDPSNPTGRKQIKDLVEKARVKIYNKATKSELESLRLPKAVRKLAKEKYAAKGETLRDITYKNAIYKPDKILNGIPFYKAEQNSSYQPPDRDITEGGVSSYPSLQPKKKIVPKYLRLSCVRYGDRVSSYANYGSGNETDAYNNDLGEPILEETEEDEILLDELPLGCSAGSYLSDS